MSGSDRHTAASLAADLGHLGVKSGMALIVHTSLRSIGKVSDGPVSVIQALESAVGDQGTIVMPTMTLNLCDPSEEPDLHPSKDMWGSVRQTIPLFDPGQSPTTYMGIVAETFRKQPGVVRSSHPHCSFAASGRCAEQVTENHGLDHALGETSPIARLYELGGWVLTLGAPKNKNSSTHLAEYRLPKSRRGTKVWTYPARIVDGRTVWDSYSDVINEDGDFDRIQDAFSRETGLVREGRVGGATSYLMPQRNLIDFAVDWMRTNRKFAEP